MTSEGRPFVRDPDEPNDELALWMPEPPRDGDPVFCSGVRVGTFRGDCARSGGWYIDTVPTAQMPPALAPIPPARAHKAP
jgi:hypothetical protein